MEVLIVKKKTYHFLLGIENFMINLLQSNIIV